MDYEDGNMVEHDLLSNYFQDGDDDNMMEFYRNNPELLKSMLQEYEEMQRNYSVYNECAVPVVTQSFDTMYQIILFCLILRLFSVIKLPSHFLNIISAFFGVCVLWQFYDYSTAYVLLPTFLLVTMHQFKQKNGGWQLSMVSLTYFLICEFYLDAKEWNKIKGSVMTIFMKIISVGFEKEDLSLIEITGYLLNPASIIFGPFITYHDFKQIFQPNPLSDDKHSLRWALSSCQALILSVVCLLWSSCGIPNLAVISNYIPITITIFDKSEWWSAFKDAQSFRFSHYFVGCFAESSCLFMGIGTFEKKICPNHKKSKEIEEEDVNLSWKRPVVKILTVEFPRSLVAVVTSWNLPMHVWLKQYIFKQTRKYGILTAIILTYVASSLLHGLNFQLSAVLLSIGIFAYIESIFRTTLAVTFSACVEARECKDCNHSYKKWNFVVMAVNLLFTFVSIWNLAYLGCLFDGSNEQEQGYSMSHAINKWKHYQFINHIFMAVLLIIQKTIS